MESRPARCELSPRSITDDDAWRLGLSALAAVQAVEDGRAVDFTFESGTVYRVPFEYVLAWCAPEAEATEDETWAERCVVSAGPVEGDPQCAHLAVDDGRELWIGWDLILMACEPCYVHFGGWTEASQALTRRRGGEVLDFRKELGRLGEWLRGMRE
jgi:hypothetical protein